MNKDMLKLAIAAASKTTKRSNRATSRKRYVLIMRDKDNDSFIYRPSEGVSTAGFKRIIHNSKEKIEAFKASNEKTLMIY